MATPRMWNSVWKSKAQPHFRLPTMSLPWIYSLQSTVRKNNLAATYKNVSAWEHVAGSILWEGMDLCRFCKSIRFRLGQHEETQGQSRKSSQSLWAWRLADGRCDFKVRRYYSMGKTQVSRRQRCGLPSLRSKHQPGAVGRKEIKKKGWFRRAFYFQSPLWKN